MASALAKWQLKRISARLKVLREELRIIDEQRSHLVDDADDLGLRAVAGPDLPLARSEVHAAGGHGGSNRRREGARSTRSPDSSGVRTRCSIGSPPVDELHEPSTSPGCPVGCLTVGVLLECVSGPRVCLTGRKDAIDDHPCGDRRRRSHHSPRSARDPRGRGLRGRR